MTPLEQANWEQAETLQNLERAIGLKWAGWIGGVVLIIGIGLGIHFAHQQGWFEQIPPIVRLGLIWLGGALLLAIGEWVYRRINALAAAGLFGAGIAVFFLASYYGYLGWALYGLETAFVFGIVSALIGSAVSMRGRMVSVAVLSQIGGHLGPILLSSGEPPGVPFLLYVFMLQVAAVTAALWGMSPKWWGLRILSVAATSIWTIVALCYGRWGTGFNHEVLWFGFLSAATFQGELLRSALLSKPEPAPAAGVPDEPLQELLDSVRSTEPGWGTVYSLLITAGLEGIILFVFYTFDRAEFRGLLTVVLAGLCQAVGLYLPSENNLQLRHLKIGFEIQALALAILFVPVTFTDRWICIGWGLLSLSLAGVGARFHHHLARGAALLTWVLALGALALQAAEAEMRGSLPAIWLNLLGHPIRDFTVIGWLLSAGGLGLAWLTQVRLMHTLPRAGMIWQVAGFSTSVAASLVFWASCQAGLPMLGVTLAVIIWAWLLVVADLAPQRLYLLEQAFAIVVLVGFKWLADDLFYQRCLPTWNAFQYWPVLNPPMGLGVLLALSLSVVGFLLKNRWPAGRQRIVTANQWSVLLLGLVLLLLGAGLYMEIDRSIEQVERLGHTLGFSGLQVKHFGWTLLWALAALILAIGCLRWRFGIVLPLAVLIVLMLKFLAIDMLGMRIVFRPAPVLPVVNLQVLTGGVLLATLYWTWTRIRPEELYPDLTRLFWVAVHGLGLLLLLGAGSLEIDRLCGQTLATRLPNPHLATLAGLSIYWSAFALICVIVGFWRDLRFLRYVGLGLFGITLCKVFLVDLEHVQYGYRVLSLLGLGLLMLAMAVVYGRVRLGRQTHGLDRPGAESRAE